MHVVLLFFHDVDLIRAITVVIFPDRKKSFPGFVCVILNLAVKNALCYDIIILYYPFVEER